jgi:hypothetical protein
MAYAFTAVEQGTFPPTVLVSATEFQSKFASGVALDGTGDYVSTPDHADLDIVGDIDLACEATLADWTPADITNLLAKDGGAGNRSYRLRINTDGTVGIVWSTDGSSVTGTVHPSTIAVPIDSGRLAVRATLDVNDGAGGWVVNFYTAASIDGPWAPLGDPVDNAGGGTTSIFSGSGNLVVGAAQDDGSLHPVTGTIHKAYVKNGIAGTVAADPDFTTPAVGASSFADSTGKTWTMQGNAEIVAAAIEQISVSRWLDETDTAVRGMIEVDVTGADAFVRTDAEFPFGVEFYYEATFTDDDGNQYTSTATPMTVTAAGYIVSDAIRGIGMVIRLHDWPEKRHDRLRSEFVIADRIVVVAGDRQPPHAAVILKTLDADQRRTLGSILTGATSNTVQFRAPVYDDDIDSFQNVLVDSIRRVPGANVAEPTRLWQLDVVETEAWPSVLEAIGFTLQDIADFYEFGTLNDIDTDFTTLLAIAQNDWSS